MFFFYKLFKSTVTVKQNYMNYDSCNNCSEKEEKHDFKKQYRRLPLVEEIFESKNYKSLWRI